MIGVERLVSQEGCSACADRHVCKGRLRIFSLACVRARIKVGMTAGNVHNQYASEGRAYAHVRTRISSRGRVDMEHSSRDKHEKDGRIVTREALARVTARRVTTSQTTLGKNGFSDASKSCNQDCNKLSFRCGQQFATTRG